MHVPALQIPQDDGENNISRARSAIILSLYGEESVSLKYLNLFLLKSACPDGEKAEQHSC